MGVATFDTLKFANTLKAAGVPDRQAEAQAVAFAEVIQINLKDLVTKDDLNHAVDELKKEIRGVADTARRETKESADTARRETQGVANDLQHAVIELKRDIAEASNKSLAEMHTAIAKLQSEAVWVRWMLGVLIALVVGIAIRMFFYRTP